MIKDPAAYRSRLDRVLARAHLVKVSEEDIEYLEPDLSPVWGERGLGRDDLGGIDLVVEATPFACLVAARTCSEPGASPPWRDEL